MEIFVEFVRVFADGILTMIQIAMLVRAVTSWFPGGDESVIGIVAYTVTEPVVIPVRKLLERSESMRNLPLDMSFFAAFMLVTVISTLMFP